SRKALSGARRRRETARRRSAARARRAHRNRARSRHQRAASGPIQAMKIARRLSDLAQSDIRRMTRECERVGGINLGQGICDLPTPELVRDGAIAAIREGRSTYSFAEGARELREAIARKLERDNGLRADPATEICVT